MRVRYPYAKTLIMAALACGATMVAPMASADRLYDREHGDYHAWDDGEDAQYRLYLGERSEPYREFREMDAEHQRAYWRWRHEHRDHERHEHEHERHDPDLK